MKQILFITGLLLCSFSLKAQTKFIKLKPSKDAMLHSLNSKVNYGNYPDYRATASTISGNQFKVRSIVYFDLSTIPSGAVIDKASLSLYFNPTSASGTHDGKNEGVLRRIVTDWDEYLVTWISQPSVTTLNEVLLPPTPTSNSNMPNIDVTNLVQDMVMNPKSSFGFLIQLRNETPYRDLVFSSSDHMDTTLHPVLEITYTITGIPDLDRNNNFTVLPNPATNTILLNSKGLSHYIVNFTNLTGKLMMIENINSKSQVVDVSMLPQGLYIMNVISNGILIKKMKIIVQ
jgi:type IX secretion system substrate protein